MTDTERRYTRGLVEVRADGNRPQIGGYAAKFGKRSQNLGGFVEQIDARFFNKSAGDGWPGVMARYNHDDNYLLGTTAGGTLRLNIDATGLDYTVDPPSHRADVVELVQRGDVSQSSFAFMTFDDDWELTEDDIPLRTLISGKLVDVAPVNNPAYLDTSSGLRSLAVMADAEYDEVSHAAKIGDLRKFLGSKAPVVIDLATSSNDDLRKLVIAAIEDRAPQDDSQGAGQGNHPEPSTGARRAELANEWLNKRRTS